MELYGKKVILRAIEESDLELLRQSTNDPEFEKMITGWALPISKKAQSDWFANQKNSLSDIKYTIADKSGKPLGLISLKGIDMKNGCAVSAGYRIADKDERGKGYAVDAWLTLLGYAFGELRLNRVGTCVIKYNEASLHVLQKVGFKIEGVQRQAIYKNGEYNDLVILGCLKSDFTALTADEDK